MSSTKRMLPPVRPTPGRAPDQVLQIAHRGGSHGAENYGPGHLARIAALGTHLVEIDIRTTADGHLVVHHDPVVVTDAGAERIAATLLRDLTELAPGRVHPITAVLRAARNAGLGVYLDIKDISDPALRRLIHLLTGEDLIGRSMLASAAATTVARCAAAAPGVPRAVLFRPVDTDPIELARTAHADFVHPCWDDENRPDKLLAGPWLDRVRGHGLGVICWHEERPDVLAALLALGVDGICTDDPALLAAVAADS
jgi:glycerophosphoryl diester phosphodiesterase